MPGVADFASETCDREAVAFAWPLQPQADTTALRNQEPSLPETMCSRTQTGMARALKNGPNLFSSQCAVSSRVRTPGIQLVLIKWIPVEPRDQSMRGVC